MEYPDSKINLSWGMQHFLQLRCVKKFQESFLRSYLLPMTPHGNGQIIPNLKCIWFWIVMCERKIYFWSFHWNWVYFQQAKKFSSSISEISSIYSKMNNTRESLTSGFGVLSNPSRSWIAKTLPNFKRKSMGKPRSDSHPTYQQCSVTPTPPMSHYYEEFRSQATPSCPPAFYNYRQSEEVQLSDADTSYPPRIWSTRWR